MPLTLAVLNTIGSAENALNMMNFLSIEEEPEEFRTVFTCAKKIIPPALIQALHFPSGKLNDRSVSNLFVSFAGMDKMATAPHYAISMSKRKDSNPLLATICGFDPYLHYCIVV